MKPLRVLCKVEGRQAQPLLSVTSQPEEVSPLIDIKLMTDRKPL